MKKNKEIIETPTRIEKYEYINKRKIKEKEIIDKQNDEKRLLRKKKFKKVAIIMLAILLVLITIILFYSRFIEPKLLIVKEYKITTDKINTKDNGLKIAHFSDLHFGSTIDSNNISNVLDKLKNINADIVVYTGDLFKDEYVPSSDEIDKIIEVFKDIPSKYGKYAVIGNHDIDKTLYENIMYKSGFKLLKNKEEVVYTTNNEPILIYGLDDVLIGNPNINNLDEIKDKYKNNFKILLVHEPDYYDNLDTYKDYFDVVFAGHTHGSQVNIPFIKKIILPPFGKNYYKEMYQFDNTTLYVSSGIGCSGLNYRFNVIPSINFYRVIKK